MRLAHLSRALPELPPSRVLQVPGRHTATMRRRVRVLAEALEIADAGDLPTGALFAALERRLGAAEPDEMWLTLAVLGASLPEANDVVRAVRTCRLDGPRAVVEGALQGHWARRLLGVEELREVEVVTGQVLVDLEHTSRTALATGIQRVARMTASRWSRDHAPVLVGWLPGQQALRRLRPHEVLRALTGTLPEDDPVVDGKPDTVVIPWRATYVLPELAPERDRTLRLSALARFSRSRTGVIGFDCVPISSAETTDFGVSEAFAGNLSAARHVSRIVAISEAAAQEYRGWRRMLSAIGVPGPEITSVPLPVEAQQPSEASLAEARERLVIGNLPLVLCIGTHEPRKNHLALLHAAEVLWRRGVRFNLVFIGGHSWNSNRFQDGVARLRAEGRPVDTLSSISDDVLWAAYRIAHCLVFPSLNEGYGLPVAEALACGTPVVTSDFGSMAEIAAHGGAVLVDPRDDSSIADGLERVLTDSGLHARLRAEATARPQRTWDDYARETWAALVSEGDLRP